VAACSGIVSALDKQGKVQWLYDIHADGEQSEFHGDPLVADRLILWGTDGNSIGHVYAFDRVTGEVVWKYPHVHKREGMSGFPVDVLRDGNRVFSVTIDETIVCLDLDKGAVVWRFSIGSEKRRVGISPVLADGRLFFGSHNGSVYAFEATWGKLLWKRDLHAPISASLAVIDQDLIVGTSNKQLYRLSQRSGRIRARMQLDQPLQWQAAPVDGDLIVVTKEQVMRIDPMLKRVRWRQKGTAEWSSPRPRLHRNAVLVGNDVGELTAYDQRTGAQLWSMKLGKSAVRAIGIDQDTLYVGTIGGELFAIAP
jgi:outer membrane protein assembly factor BamB